MGKEFVLLDGSGDLASKRPTIDRISKQVSVLYDYWWQAAACGHPSAPRHANERMDSMTIDYTDAHEDETGYLDREP